MIDLEEEFNLTNKRKHPTNTNKTVYRFIKEEQALYFTELLVEEGIEFEVQVDEEHERKPTYFGVSKSVESKVDKLNFVALGKGRDKFIASAPMRWVLLTIFFLVLFLAIMGALSTP